MSKVVQICSWISLSAHWSNWRRKLPFWSTIPFDGHCVSAEDKDQSRWTEIDGTDQSPSSKILKRPLEGHACSIMMIVVQSSDERNHD